MAVSEIVEASLRLPVAIDNPANLAELGELHYCASRGLRAFILAAQGRPSAG